MEIHVNSTELPKQYQTQLSGLNEFTKKGKALPSKVKTNNADEHNKKPLNLEAARSVPPCKVLARDYAASKGKGTAS